MSTIYPGLSASLCGASFVDHALQNLEAVCKVIFRDIWNVRSTNDLDRSSVPLFLIAVSMMIHITYSPPCSSSDNSFFLQQINSSSPLVFHPSSFVSTLWAVSLSLSLGCFSASGYWMRTKIPGLLMSSHPWPSVLCYLWLRDLFTTDSISQHARHHHMHLSGCVSVCSKA